MSTSYSDYDPASLASAMVTAYRSGMDTLLSNKETKYESLVSGYSSLSGYLDDFQDLLEEYTAYDSEESLSSQSCTLSDDDYCTVTSDGTAANGNYSIKVDQLATAQQNSLTFSSDDLTSTLASLTGDSSTSSGVLSLTVDGETLTIDFSDLGSSATLQTLVSAINKSDDNPGVTASLVQSGDTVYLMLTSDDTGEEYAYTATYSDSTYDSTSTTDDASDDSTFASAFSSQTEMTAAQDAIIELGSTNAITLTSSSNTMDDVLDGLTITLTKAQDTDDDPLNLTVAVDADTSESNLQSFVDSFNELIDNLNTLYDDDGDLDGNSTVRTLISELKNAFRNSLPDGYSLSDLGLEFGSDGTLSIDSDTLEAALKSDPDILNTCLTDDGGVFDALDDLLDPYTKTGGILDDASDTAQDSLDRVEDRIDAWNEKMENLYNTYLDQFTQMQVTLAELESSLSYLST